MKRIGTILILSIIFVLSAGSPGFAAGLSLVDIYPKEGESRLQPANVAVKMIFSENMTSLTAQAANEGNFFITDEKGKPVEYNALYNEKKYPNEIWLLLTKPLEADSRYTLTISKDLQSSAGNTLDEEIITHFAARNTKTDTNGYMFLMVLMIVGMVGFTVWDNRRKEKKESTKQDEEKKINPYKEARRTGKSVEEIVAKIEQEKAKQERRRAKAGSGKADSSEDERREGVYRLKCKRSIKDVGAAVPESVVARNRAKEKAKAEAKAASEKRRKKQTARSKGSKQQRKKKK